MKQFDIYRNAGKNRVTIPYVVVVQSSCYRKSRRRVVVSLILAEELGKITDLPKSGINPRFIIEGVNVVLSPLDIVSVPIESLGVWVGSLAEDGDVIVAALDELFSRAWG